MNDFLVKIKSAYKTAYDFNPKNSIGIKLIQEFCHINFLRISLFSINFQEQIIECIWFSFFHHR